MMYNFWELLPVDLQKILILPPKKKRHIVQFNNQTQFASPKSCSNRKIIKFTKGMQNITRVQKKTSSAPVSVEGACNDFSS